MPCLCRHARPSSDLVEELTRSVHGEAWPASFAFNLWALGTGVLLTCSGGSAAVDCSSYSRRCSRFHLFGGWSVVVVACCTEMWS